MTVDWGDGNTDTYTGNGQRTHTYSMAGVWPVTISPASDLVALGLNDNKISGTINSSNPIPPYLEYLSLSGVAGVSWTIDATAPVPSGLTELDISLMSSVFWTIGAGVPMPAGLKTLRLMSTQGISWAVGAGVPIPAAMEVLYLNDLSGLSWTVGASAPMPNTIEELSLLSLSGVHWTIGGATPFPNALYRIDLNGVFNVIPGSSAVWQKNELRYIRYLNALTASEVDDVLISVSANKANYIGVGLELNLKGGANAAPGGTYQDPFPNPPVSGKEALYILENNGNYPGTNWSVMTA